MTPLFALRALLFAGELLAGSSVIMAFAWALSAQRRASARHLAWASTFGAALLLPLLLAILPSPLRILLPASPEAIPVQTMSDAASAATLAAPADSGISLDPVTIALALGDMDAWNYNHCTSCRRRRALSCCAPSPKPALRVGTRGSAARCRHAA
jgi:hypothetical protein